MFQKKVLQQIIEEDFKAFEEEFNAKEVPPLIYSE